MRFQTNKIRFGQTTRTFRLFLAMAIAVALVFNGAYFTQPQSAFADEDEYVATGEVRNNDTSDGGVDELALRVEQTSRDYNDAQAAVDELNNQIAITQTNIDALEAQLPSQQAACDTAMISYYKYQSGSSSFFDLVFSAASFDTALRAFEYYDSLNNQNITTIINTASMVRELETDRAALDADKALAEQRAQEAADALAAAQEAREEAMRRAAEEAAAQAAAAQAAAEAAAESSSGDAGVSGYISLSDVDWSLDKQAFVDEWAPRIDAYLAGSPLGGYGVNFAAAAWDYGVDPRWSPAISNTESSKGVHCFRSHNAWGWGSKSWGSWEEAIDAHVSGLSRIYGSTITLSAAQKYCPPSSVSWYNKTLAQMEMI